MSNRRGVIKQINSGFRMMIAKIVFNDFNECTNDFISKYSNLLSVIFSTFAHHKINKGNVDRESYFQ